MRQLSAFRRTKVGSRARLCEWDASTVIEAVLTETLKPRGFRKRTRNWFRTTSAGQYQVVNLQKSSWGSGDCYLNLGWDRADGTGHFLPENHCLARFRAERTDVIPRFEMPRTDGLTVSQVPGISLLDHHVFERYSEDAYRDQVREIVAEPVANLMDRTASVTDLVPLYLHHPEWATLRLRDYLRTLGYELPPDA